MKGLTSIVDFSETICRNTYCVILVGAEIFELTRAKLKIVTYLINNRRMFNLEIDDLGVKQCIPHKSLLQ